MAAESVILHHDLLKGKVEASSEPYWNKKWKVIQTFIVTESGNLFQDLLAWKVENVTKIVTASGNLSQDLFQASRGPTKGLALTTSLLGVRDEQTYNLKYSNSIFCPT